MVTKGHKNCTETISFLPGTYVCHVVLDAQAEREMHEGKSMLAYHAQLGCLSKEAKHSSKTSYSHVRGKSTTHEMPHITVEQAEKHQKSGDVHTSPRQTG
jgi:hypothetical protein